MTVARTNGKRAAILALIGLVLAFGLPETELGRLIAPGRGVGPQLVREAVWWAFGGIILFWVVKVERLPLASIGLKRPTAGTWLWAVAAAVGAMASIMLSYSVIFPALGLKMNMAVVNSITSMPLWLMVGMMLRAGVVEEILYRGYAIERIEALTGSKWLAAGVSAGIFTLTHLASWGAAQLIVVAFGALIMTLVYLWRRDLVTNMTAHFLVDFVGFMLARLQT